VSGETTIHWQCSAILFDLDGVLVDSTPAVARQWRLWAKENQIPPKTALEIAHGRRTVEVVRLLAPHLDAESETLKIEKREAEDTEGVTLIKGALELTSSLPPDRWGVVTSGTYYLASSRLQRHGLPMPRALISADDVRNGKPHPEPYLKGAQRLGMAPEKCLVVEDAPAGIQSARAAGMRAIALTTTYPRSALADADVIVRDLTQVRANSTADGLELVIVESF
jgi:sugar-phosphatase